MADPRWPQFANVIVTTYNVNSWCCGKQRKRFWTYCLSLKFRVHNLDILRVKRRGGIRPPPWIGLTSASIKLIKKPRHFFEENRSTDRFHLTVGVSSDNIQVLSKRGKKQRSDWCSYTFWHFPVRYQSTNAPPIGIFSLRRAYGAPSFRITNWNSFRRRRFFKVPNDWLVC